MSDRRNKGPTLKSGNRGAAVLALLVAAASLVLTGPAACDGIDRTGSEPAAFPDSVIKGLQKDVHRAMKKGGIQGLAIAVVGADGRSWTAGFGSAGEGRPLTARTPVMVASVTKLFTAVAVMKLVEEGLVDLDAPIGTYVPEMKGVRYAGAAEPTVRNLLTHHGGIVSDLLKGTLPGGPAGGHKEAFMALVPLIAAQAPTEPPRLLAHYSNAGYFLLGALVANVSGRPYVDYVEEQILQPLGMRDSGFLDPRTDDRLSRGYAGRQVAMPQVPGGPEGGLAASADDLARFLTMILGGVSGAGRVIEEATLRQMMSRQNAGVALDLDFEMGLAFHIMTLPGYPEVRVAWHDGGIHPFASTLLVAPDYGVGVAVVSNTDEKVPAELAYKALAVAIEAETGRRLAHSRPYRFGAMSGRVLRPEELRGVYASEIGAVAVGGTARRPTLTMGGKTLYLVPKERGIYGLQARLWGLLPLPIADLTRLRLAFREIEGSRVVGIYESGKFRSIGTGVEPEAIPDAWISRIGDWAVTNPDPEPFVTALSLGYDKALGFMMLSVKVASVPDPFVIPVVPRGRDTLVTAGLGRHMGETLRVSGEPGVERMTWAGLALERKLPPAPADTHTTEERE